MDDGKRYTEYGLFGALAIGLVAGLLAGMAIYAAAYPVFQSSNGAAWVQALGAILALIVAVLLSVNERKAMHREREQERFKQDYAIAFDIAALATELHMHVCKLMQFATDERTVAGLDRSLYLSEVLFFQDFQRRLSWCTSGYTPAGHKNLGIDIRDLAFAVTPYVLARSLSENPPEPDWITLSETASRLYDQAKMAIPSASG